MSLEITIFTVLRKNHNNNNLKTRTMEVTEFVRKIESGEAKVLTVEAARSLEGKAIYWMYFGSHENQNQVYTCVIGNIVSEIQYYETQPCEGFSSRAEYWRSYMKERQLDEKENTLILLDEDGKDTLMRARLKNSFFDVPTFTCSDADRECYFLLK